MVMVADDLEKIFAEKTDKLASRRGVLGLLGVVVVFFIILVGLAAALSVASVSVVRWNWLYGGERCATPDCLRTAAWVADSISLDNSGSMNVSAAAVDPCDDFYQFSCGSWEKRHFIPPDDSEVTMIDLLQKDVTDRLRLLIERGASPRSRTNGINTTSQSIPSAALKLRNYYASCMHDYGRMISAGKELIELIRTNIGPWYLEDPNGWTNDTSMRSRWDFQEALVNVQLIQSVFHQAWIDKDRLTGGHIMLMTHADLGLSSYLHYFREDKLGIREAYKDYMRQLAKLLIRDANITVTPSQADQRIEQFVNDVYGQEEQLARILQQARSQGDMRVTQRTTIGEMDRDYPQLNWLRYLRKVFQDPSLDEDRPVMIRAPVYFRQVDDMLRNESEQHIRKRVINNYLVWKLAKNFAPELSSDYREAGAKFRQAAYGIAYMPTTWQMCLETAKSRLGSILAWLYVKAHFAPNVKQQVSTLFENVREVLTQRLDQLQWMDEITRSRAKEKINGVEVVVGFADIYYDDVQMEQIHASLDISKSQSYFKNILAVRNWQRNQRIRLFITDPPISWHHHMPLIGWSSLWAVRPFYSYYTHSLVVPAGALSDPSFDTARSDVFNYGILGSEIAATLMYLVGETGRYIWTNGSFTSWWTNATSVEYRKTKDCFDNYFSGLNVGPLNIDGKYISVPVNFRLQSYLAVGEHGGLLTSLLAYNERVKSRSDALPVGLSMTPDQLYFISVAQKYCYLRTDQARYKDALNGFIPEDYELNALLSHLPQFTKAFNCKIGSKMRIANQCQVF